MNAGKAGLVAGIPATMVIALIIVAGMISPPPACILPVGTGYFLFITITLYLVLFALFGGLIAGAARK
jgi:hypothetical protein